MNDTLERGVFDKIGLVDRKPNTLPTIEDFTSNPHIAQLFAQELVTAVGEMLKYTKLFDELEFPFDLSDTHFLDILAKHKKVLIVKSMAEISYHLSAPSTGRYPYLGIASLQESYPNVRDWIVIQKFTATGVGTEVAHDKLDLREASYFLDLGFPLKLDELFTDTPSHHGPAFDEVRSSLNPLTIFGPFGQKINVDVDDYFWNLPGVMIRTSDGTNIHMGIDVGKDAQAFQPI